jgi:hypothetical protein
MPIINADKLLAAASAATKEGRGPAMVAAPEAASPELLTRPLRRTFSARDKLRILREADDAKAVSGQFCVARVFTRLLFRIGADNVTLAPSRR